MQEPETQHLLIRIRLVEQTAGRGHGRLTVDVEAQVNHVAIYPAGRVDIDLSQLESCQDCFGNEYGRLLGQKLCGSLPLQAALAAVARATNLRVQLMLEPSGSPLSRVRWERLEFSALGAKGPLALLQQTPFSRFAAVNQEESEPPADTPFHLLVFSASPNGLPAVSAAAEFQNLRNACGSLLDRGWLNLTFAPGLQDLTEADRQQLSHLRVDIHDGASTLENIAGLLTKDRYTGLHVIAHGRFIEEEFELMLEDSEGEISRTKAEDLITTWNLPNLRLIYLQSCQSGVSADEAGKDPKPHVAGFMQQLIEAGVPGVIAMQDNILMEDAGHFCRGFYPALLRDGLADAAVNAGRSLIQNNSANPDKSGARWSIPAFASRLVNASVWVQSPLRAAQEKLKRQIEASWKARYFRELPIDVLVTGKTTLETSTRIDAEEVNPTSRQNRLLVKAKDALQKAATVDDAPAFTCIIGSRGRAKSQLLERVFLDAFNPSSNCDGGNSARICVMLGLSDCAHPAYDSHTKVATLARAIANYYENSTGTVLCLQSLIEKIEHEDVLFLVHGDDHVGRRISDGLQLLRDTFNETRANGKRHRFILTLDQNELRASNLPDDACCLLIQPMRAERVREFLLSGAGDAEKKVLQVLEDFALFDLAEVPWLLNEMIGQARRGTLKQSRADIIGRVVDDGISRYTGSSVTANRVREALQRFAWEVQNRRNYFLPEREAYEILQELRGNRDYPLFGFLSEMIESCNILASVSEDGIGFNYPGFRTYFAAEYLACQEATRRKALLEDITAQLGRQSRAENWRETLYILAGRWDCTADLLSMILSGSLLHQGEQLYIAARCLQEARLRFHGPLRDDPIVRSIVSSLLQLASPGLRSVATRSKAIGHLGPLRELNAIRPLASIILDRRRSLNQSGQDSLLYDYSGTRIAAMKALAFSKEAFHEAVRKNRRWRQIPNLEELLVAWKNSDGKQLVRFLKTDCAPVSDMAAFSLALARFGNAFEALTISFDQPNLTPETLWPLTDALLELADSKMEEFIQSRLGRKDRHEVIAHMIGRIGIAKKGSQEWDFLWSNLESPNRKLAGRCLQALGELLCVDALPVCRTWLLSKPANNAYFALQALRNIGEWKDLNLIEQLQWNALRDDSNKQLFLDSVRTEVYDSIYWRLAGGLSREVMAAPGSPIRHRKDSSVVKTMKVGG